jgi:hypothetical protein
MVALMFNWIKWESGNIGFEKGVKPAESPVEKNFIVLHCVVEASCTMLLVPRYIRVLSRQLFLCGTSQSNLRCMCNILIYKLKVCHLFRFSMTEETSEIQSNNIDWQEIIAAIEATQDQLSKLLIT